MLSFIRNLIKPIGMKPIDMMERCGNPQFVTCRLRLCSVDLYRLLAKNVVMYNSVVIRALAREILE